MAKRRTNLQRLAIKGLHICVQEHIGINLDNVPKLETTINEGYRRAGRHVFSVNINGRCAVNAEVIVVLLDDKSARLDVVLNSYRPIDGTASSFPHSRFELTLTL